MFWSCCCWINFRWKVSVLFVCRFQEHANKVFNTLSADSETLLCAPKVYHRNDHPLKPLLEIILSVWIKQYKISVRSTNEEQKRKNYFGTHKSLSCVHWHQLVSLWDRPKLINLCADRCSNIAYKFIYSLTDVIVFSFAILFNIRNKGKTFRANRWCDGIKVATCDFQGTVIVSAGALTFADTSCYQERKTVDLGGAEYKFLGGSRWRPCWISSSIRHPSASARKFETHWVSIKCRIE